MDYGRFVGRIGTLAAALGIGLTVASSTALAQADSDGSASHTDSGSAVRDSATRATDTRQPRLSRSGQVKNRASTVDARATDFQLQVENLEAETEVLDSETGFDTLPRDRTDRDQSTGPVEITDESAKLVSSVDLDDTSAATEATESLRHEVIASTTVSHPDTPSMAPRPSAATLEISVTQPSKSSVPITVPEPLVPNGPPAPLASPALLVLLAAGRRMPPASESLSRMASGAEAAALTMAVVNNKPTITSIFVGNPGLFSARVTGRVRASDADRDKLTYSAKVGKGTVAITSRGSFTYRPTAAARHAAAAGATTDTLTVTVTDSAGASTSMVVTVPIRPANIRPTARAVVRESNPATGVVTGVVTASDRDGDKVTFAGTGTTSKGSFVVKADGTFSYTPTAAAREAAKSLFRRADRFTVTVNDGHGGTRAVTVRVRILPPSNNQAPVAGSPAYTISSVSSSTGVVTGKVNVTDPDGFALAYKLAKAIDSKVGKVSVNAATGVFTFTPTTSAREKAHGTSGKDTVKFSVTASDGAATASVTVTAEISPKASPASTPTLSQRVAAFVNAFKGKVWGAARHGTKPYTNRKSMTNDKSSPYYTEDLVGECVSLVTQFLKYAFNITPGQWGHAREWVPAGSGGKQMAATKRFEWHPASHANKNGDILVFSSNHIGVYYNGKLFDANDIMGGRAADGLGGWAARHAGFGTISAIPGYVGFWRARG